MKGLLTSLNATTWDELVVEASGATWAWADLDGFHIGPCPVVRPATSIAWGWTEAGDVAYRLRIGSDGSLVAGRLDLKAEPRQVGEVTVETTQVPTIDPSKNRRYPDRNQEALALVWSAHLVVRFGSESVVFYTAR